MWYQMKLTPIICLVMVATSCQALDILNEMKTARDNSLDKLMKQAKIYSCMVADLKTLRKEGTLACVGKLIPSIMENVAQDCFGDDTVPLVDRAETFCKASDYSVQDALEKATCATQRLTQMQYNELNLAASQNGQFDIKTFLDDVNQCYTSLQIQQSFTD